MSEKIERMMRQVKLGGMAKEWRSVQFENIEQYVTDLLERDANRMAKTVGFRIMKTLDDFVGTSAIELPNGLTAGVHGGAPVSRAQGESHFYGHHW